MRTVIILLVLSALLGFATGLRFKVFAVVALSVLIAISSAIIVRASGFEFATGGIVIVGCLTVSQLAYGISSVFVIARKALAQNVSCRGPSDDRQNDVQGQEGSQDDPPSRTSSMASD
jgi:hypothetical protein